MSNPFATIGPKLVGQAASMFQESQQRGEQRANDAIGPISGGVLLEAVDVTNGSFTDINHKLGRPWKGFIKVNDDTGVSLWAQESSDDSLFISLQATSNATVSLWVF